MRAATVPIVHQNTTTADREAEATTDQPVATGDWAPSTLKATLQLEGASQYSKCYWERSDVPVRASDDQASREQSATAHSSVRSTRHPCSRASMCRYAALANVRLPITDSGPMALDRQFFMAVDGQKPMSADTSIEDGPRAVPTTSLDYSSPGSGALPAQMCANG